VYANVWGFGLGGHALCVFCRQVHLQSKIQQLQLKARRLLMPLQKRNQRQHNTKTEQRKILFNKKMK